MTELGRILEADPQDVPAIIKNYGALKTARGRLRKIETYSEDQPFALPSGAASKKAEAEMFVLDASGVVQANKYVRITEKAEASNGKEVNWFEEGNRIYLPFTAVKTGAYKVTVTYRSGRDSGNPNALEWSGANIGAGGSLDVYGGADDAANVYHTADFEIVVNQTGAGQLVFTASSKGGSVIDKFVFQKKLESDDLTAAVSAAEAFIAQVEGNYTAESLAAYQAAVNNAKNPSAEATEEEIRQLLSAIEDAKQALVYNEEYKQAVNALNEAVAGAKEIIAKAEGNYTSASFADFKNAVNNAKNRPETAAKSELEGLLSAIETAKEALRHTREYSQKVNELNDAVTEADAIIERDESKYTTESWTVFKAAVNNAKNLPETATKEDIEKLISAIDIFREALEISEEYQQAVQALEDAVAEAGEIIEKAESNYMPESFAKYVEAVNNAKDVPETATEEEIRQLMSAIETAKKSLKYNEKYQQAADELDHAITGADEVFAKDKNKYTPESWAKFEEALNNAKNVLETATEQKVAYAASYEIYRKSGTAAAVKIATVTTNAYEDKAAPGGTQLTYTVVALPSSSDYTKSPVSAGASLTFPKAVTGLKAKVTGGKVKISFKKVKGAKSYLICRATKKNGTYKKLEGMIGSLKADIAIFASPPFGGDVFSARFMLDRL